MHISKSLQFATYAGTGKTAKVHKMRHMEEDALSCFLSLGTLSVARKRRPCLNRSQSTWGEAPQHGRSVVKAMEVSTGVAVAED